MIVLAVLCAVALAPVVLILLGAYMLASGRVPPPARFWGAPNWRTGAPLVRPRLLGLSLVLWAGWALVLVSLMIAGLGRYIFTNAPTLPFANVVPGATPVVFFGVLLLVFRRAYQARPEEDSRNSSTFDESA